MPKKAAPPGDKQSFKVALGKRIAEARIKARLQQHHLGDQKTVSRWETGTTIPSAFAIGEIAKRCGTSTDYLILGVPPTEHLPPALLHQIEILAEMATSRHSRSVDRVAGSAGGQPDRLD